MRKATAGEVRNIMALGFLFICNGLANPYEATVVLFSTMIMSIHVVFNEATGHFIISSFHHFVISSFHYFIQEYVASHGA